MATNAATSSLRYQEAGAGTSVSDIARCIANACNSAGNQRIFATFVTLDVAAARSSSTGPADSAGSNKSEFAGILSRLGVNCPQRRFRALP
jgi:hypothetical protein